MGGKCKDERASAGAAPSCGRVPDGPKLPPAPRHLRPETRGWWRELVSLYDFGPHHLRLLQAACESWDRAEQARELLDDEGVVLVDRFGQSKAHPATIIERDARSLFCKCLLSLGLDVPPPDGGRKRR